MIKLLLAALLFLQVVYSTGLYAEIKARETSNTGNTRVTDTTDIHYTGLYCLECHEQTPANGSGKLLKYGGDFEQLCRCHYDTDTPYVHPVDIKPPKEIKSRIPTGFPLSKGKITCITCHDVFLQCRENLADKILLKGKMLLRGGPYKNRTSICFICHDDGKYRKLNPHEQLDKKGAIIVEKCLYCHEEKPDEKRAKHEDIKLIGDYESLCERCHMRRNRRSLHDSHIRIPSPKVLARIKQMENEFGIVLPLSDSGKVTCATCHNPHEKGVIPDYKAGSKIKGEGHRHRLSGNLCIKCHQLW